MPDEPTTPPEDSKAQAAETDWQAKFEAQRKVNRDLETKFNELRDNQASQRDAFAQALGLKPEETSDVSRVAQQVADLQSQFARTQQENNVLSLANQFGITSKDDLDLLRAVTDTNVMQTIAQRIAKQAEPSTAPGPRPDLTQGGKPEAGGGNNANEAFGRFLQAQLNS